MADINEHEKALESFFYKYYTKILRKNNFCTEKKIVHVAEFKNAKSLVG